MSEMTPEAALALRKPFPKEMVGKLPKGGTLLDYVGHAAVTDRLLTVDPAWSWEPLALDAAGLPALDKSGNLWIRLTICGVTRLGVGDGKNAKEVVGDAIRNAAMRFGVALDLWAKENLVEFAQAARAHQTGIGALRAAVAEPEPAPAEKSAEPPATPASSRTAAAPKPVSKDQLKALHASFNEAGITGRDDRLKKASEVIGRALETSNELTSAECSRVIDALKATPEPEWT